MSVVVFLLALPLAVYVSAGLFAFVDLDDTARALQRASVRGLVTVLYLLLVGIEHLGSVMAAFALVALLHVARFTVLRWLIRRGTFIVDRLD